MGSGLLAALVPGMTPGGARSGVAPGPDRTAERVTLALGGQRASTQPGVHFGERRAAGAKLRFSEAVERRFDRVHPVVQILGVGIDVEQARDELARRLPLLQIGACA